MKFQVTRHETATWDDETEQDVLSPAVETVMEFEAEYPALARELVQDLERSTRVETQTRRLKGRAETLTVYLANPAAAMQAWRTANGVLALRAV